MAVCKGILGQVKASPRDEPFYFPFDGAIAEPVNIFIFHMTRMDWLWPMTQVQTLPQMLSDSPVYVKRSSAR